jgi:hypothetical protein
VHPHQLRHTYATSLVNGGMSLEALMAVLGHVTPEMTLRYAHLASDTIRDAYDAAIAKTRPKPLLVAGPTGRFVPDRLEWLHSEWLKTRVAHGFCSRHPAAGACPYANICEQCDNFVPDPNRRDVIAEQLARHHPPRRCPPPRLGRRGHTPPAPRRRPRRPPPTARSRPLPGRFSLTRPRGPDNRLRVPELRQLPTPTPPALRRTMATSSSRINTTPPTTHQRVEIP